MDQVLWRQIRANASSLEGGTELQRGTAEALPYVAGGSQPMLRDARLKRRVEILAKQAGARRRRTRADAVGLEQHDLHTRVRECHRARTPCQPAANDGHR